MVSRFAAETATAAATAVFGLVVVRGSLEFGIGWDGAGPQPGAFPFYVGLLVALASLGTLGQTIVRRYAGPGLPAEVFLDGAGARRVVAFLMPMLGFVALSVTLGMYVATVVYLAFAMRVQGGYGWMPTLTVSLATAIFFYLSLEKFFQIGLIKGPVEAWLGL